MSRPVLEVVTAASARPGQVGRAFADWFTGVATEHGIFEVVGVDLAAVALHQTWMDEERITDVLKSERMGHEVPGMRGVYSHVSAATRAELTTALQGRCETSLRERAQLAPAQSS